MKTGNLILDALSGDDALALEPSLETFDLKLKEQLFSPQDRDGYAYFPTTGVISLLRGFENGAVIEVGIVGHEGVAGIHAFLGEDLDPTHAIVQCPGKGYRVRDARIRELFLRGGEFQTLLLRFTYALIVQISQTAACNQLHLADQRLARWLLAMADRIEEDVIPLTHEFLAHMLGASRARVSDALRRFRDGGAVECSRNQILIRDRSRLEAWACECYEAVRTVDQDVATGDRPSGRTATVPERSL